MKRTTERTEQLARFVPTGQSERVAEELGCIHPGEAAALLRELPRNSRVDTLLALPPEQAADILEELPDDMAAAVVMGMEPDAAAPIVQEMQTDEEVDLLQDVSADHAEAILEHVDQGDAAIARTLLSYDEDTAGGLMQAEFIAVPRGMAAGDAVRQLRSRAVEYADYPASYLYIVDDDGRLDGVVNLRSLLLCEADTVVDRIKFPDAVSVPADMPAEELVKVFRRYHYLAVPVISDDGKLLGVITQDDALRVAEEQADEEMLRFTGIAGGDEFRVMPLHRRSGRRLSWLSINILLNVVAASVIALYQETLQAVIALAVFLPIISDMSGCSGNQAVAVSIRELSLDRIRPRDFLWVAGKELSVGLFNGLALGMIIGLVAWGWKGNGWLGAIVGAALWINTLVAVTIGGLVPLILRRFRRDPAIGSGAILTTLTDMCGFFMVLGLASRYLYLLE